MNTKERVLALLTAGNGTHISGEALADELHVSRNAVWKAIKALRQEGWQITAATNRGYCLEAHNDVLSAQRILQLIGEPIDCDLPDIRLMPSAVSTNQTAKELAVSDAGHGTAVIAETQTGGRGRYARAFYSPAGGLYLSVILRPETLQLSQITAVTAFAAVAACEAIEAVSGFSPQIKWVNDLFLSGKKICGILTEAVTDIESGSIGWVVLGIGINVTAPPEGFPPELREIAGAVFPQAVPDARNRIAAELLRRLLPKAPPSVADVYAAYKSRMMLLGDTVTVQRGDISFRAVAEDIDSAGHLLLRLPDGTVQALSSGEIRILP